MIRSCSPGLSGPARPPSRPVAETERGTGSLYPDQCELRQVSRKIAVAVVKEARDLRLGRHASDEQIKQFVSEAMWAPEYPVYENPV